MRHPITTTKMVYDEIFTIFFIITVQLLFIMSFNYRKQEKRTLTIKTNNVGHKMK